jgi:hypothetical protein
MTVAKIELAIEVALIALSVVCTAGGAPGVGIFLLLLALGITLAA